MNPLSSPLTHTPLPPCSQRPVTSLCGVSGKQTRWLPWRWVISTLSRKVKFSTRNECHKFISGQDLLIGLFIHSPFVGGTDIRRNLPQEQDRVSTDCIFMRTALQGGADAPTPHPEHQLWVPQGYQRKHLGWTLRPALPSGDGGPDSRKWEMLGQGQGPWRPGPGGAGGQTWEGEWKASPVRGSGVRPHRRSSAGGDSTALTAALGRTPWGGPVGRISWGGRAGPW